MTAASTLLERLIHLKRLEELRKRAKCEWCGQLLDKQHHRPWLHE
jgi:hypothetical protein